MRLIAPSIAFILMVAGCSQEEKKEATSKEQGSVKQTISKKSKPTEGLECSVEKEKILCKLHVKRVNYKRDVSFKWESPNTKDNRKREMHLSANYANIFDIRLKKGRAKGLWKVEVEVDDLEYTSRFNID